MSSYEVHYFPVGGRAGVVRLALAAAGVEWKNVTPNWPADKPKYAPSFQLPALIVKDGESGELKQIPESMAMLRHIGRVYNLYGTSENERVQIDIGMEKICDIFNVYIKAYFGSDDKEKALKVFNEDVMVKQMESLDRLLSLNPHPFLAGTSLSIADLFLYNLFTADGVTAAPTPKIQAVMTSVLANAGVAAFMKSGKYFK